MKFKKTYFIPTMNQSFTYQDAMEWMDCHSRTGGYPMTTDEYNSMLKYYNLKEDFQVDTEYHYDQI